MSDDGKKLGVAGGVLAAAAALFAHGGGSCTRAGVRTATIAGETAAVGRVGVHVGETVGAQGTRVGARVGESAAQAGPRGLSAGRGAMPRALIVTATEDGARARPWWDVAEDLGKQAVQEGADLVLDACAGDDPSKGAGAPSPGIPGADEAVAPRVVAFVPTSPEGYRRGLGKAPDLLSRHGVAGIAAAFAGRGEASDPIVLDMPSRAELAARWSTIPAGPTIVIAQGLSSDAAPLIAELEALCLQNAQRCAILSCERNDLRDARPCATRAKASLDAALDGGRAGMRAAIASVLAARDAARDTDLAIYAVSLADEKATPVRSRFIPAR